MTNPSNIFGRSLSFPLRVGTDGRLVWSQGEDNIRESIVIILKTEPGERIALAKFGAGLNRFLYEPNTPATHKRIEEAITNSLARFEPRIQVESVEVIADTSLPSTALATIIYRLVATGGQERMSVSISLSTSG